MTSSNETSDPIPLLRELSEQLSKGNVVLFIGAGLSMGAGLLLGTTLAAGRWWVRQPL